MKADIHNIKVGDFLKKFIIKFLELYVQELVTQPLPCFYFGSFISATVFSGNITKEGSYNNKCKFTEKCSFRGIGEYGEGWSLQRLKNVVF